METSHHLDELTRLRKLVAAQQQKITNLEKIISLIPCSVYWKDKNGYYMGCNDNNLRITGCNTQQDFIGKKSYQLLKHPYADEIEKTDQQILASGEEKILEESYFDFYGKPAIYLTHKIPLFDENHNVSGLLGVSFDITDRKKIELELKETKEIVEKQCKISNIYLNNLIASLPENFYWKDRDGRVIACNENQAKVFGLTHTELLGKNIYDIAKVLGWDKSIPDKIHQNDLAVMKFKLAKNGEEKVILNGEKITFFVHKSPMIDDEGEVIGVFGIGIDITECKKIEEELVLAKEKAEQATKAIKIFADSVAHELRTPLASLNGYIYGIRKYLPIFIQAYRIAKENQLPVGVIRPDHYQSMSRVNQNMVAEINHANAIIDMILLQSDPNKLKNMNPKTCSIIKCVNQALERYPFKSTDEISLIKWQEKANFLFLGEELLAIHVLFNLTKNALYFIAKKQKGEIFIETKTGKKFNSLHFKDTSAGINKENLAKIFQLYFSQTPHGTGIGLAFCKQVMTIFGGDIVCTSKPNEYTEFILTFPILNINLAEN